MYSLLYPPSKLPRCAWDLQVRAGRRNGPYFSDGERKVMRHRGVRWAAQGEGAGQQPSQDKNQPSRFLIQCLLSSGCTSQKCQTHYARISGVRVEAEKTWFPVNKIIITCTAQKCSPQLSAHFRVGRPGGPGAHQVAQSFEHWLTLKLWDASPITPPLSGHLINWSLKEPPYLQRPTAGWRKRGLWLWKRLPWLVLLLSFSWSRRYKWVKGGENRKKNVKFYSCKSIHRQ